MNVVTVLENAFRRLAPDQQANLVYHAEKKTSICCGDEAWYYTNGRGGG